MIIRDIKARQILDSRGNPTVEVDVITDNVIARAGVPSGASTGIHEAWELRDKKAAFGGASVLQAIENINTKIKPRLVGRNVVAQQMLDQIMIDLDGTKNKKNLGANAILGVSIAICKAAAHEEKMHWYEYIKHLYGQVYHGAPKEIVMPATFFNVLNGGKHAGNPLPFQECMICPTGATSVEEAIRMGSEVYQNLKKIIKKEYGQDAINVGDEGGFAPPLQRIDLALDLLMQAIDSAGYAGRIKLGMDAAASELFVDGKYDVDFKKPDHKTHKLYDTATLHKTYTHLIEKYPFVSLEDPFDQDDWEGHRKLLAEVGHTCQIVGDDLLVTNPTRVEKGIKEEAANALLLKINQIGTISEAMLSASLAHKAGWNIMVSHRSGETEDPFIADLAVGISSGQIKSGAPCRSERTAKYNQLLRIEEHALATKKPVRYGW